MLDPPVIGAEVNAAHSQRKYPSVFPILRDLREIHYTLKTN